METITFTVTAILLYFLADLIVDRIERSAGRRLEHRSLLFFGILLVLAVASFAMIRRLAGQ